MLFSTPLAAAGTIAAAASVPIIIHLLNRRRYRIVDWAAMRFLLAAQRQNVRRLRLEQWLLLAVRCAILVLLAVALAAVTPWAESLWQRLMPGGGVAAPIVSGRTHKVLILDGTLSMTVRGADGTHFDRARRLAAELVRSSARGDGFSVILVGTPVEAVVPGPAEDPAKVEHEIDGLRCSHGAGDLTAALNLAEELIRRAPENSPARNPCLYGSAALDLASIGVTQRRLDRTVDSIASTSTIDRRRYRPRRHGQSFHQRFDSRRSAGGCRRPEFGDGNGFQFFEY